MKSINFLLVHFSDTPAALKPAYLRGLAVARQDISAWLLKQGLMVPSWNISEAAFSVRGSVYNEKHYQLTKDLMAKGTIRFDGQSAWYVFPTTCEMGGSFGADIFGQLGGQAGNRVPGVSYFGRVGVRALASGKEGSWTRAMACGAIAHELCHNIGLLPDQPTGRALHGPKCVMTAALYGFPDCVLEASGGVWGEKKGNEIEALASYGFVRKVQ